MKIENKYVFHTIKDLLKEGHSAKFRIAGNSMRPFFEDRRDDVLLTTFSSLQKYDIVLAEISDDIFVLHRIIEINDDDVILMGDGSISKKETCKKSQVVGVVKSFNRNGRTIICNSKKYLLFSKIWVHLRPFRRILLKIYKIICL